MEQPLSACCTNWSFISGPQSKASLNLQAVRLSLIHLFFFCLFVVVNCGNPADLTNGAFSYVNKPADNNYQSVITYRCNEPYYHIVTGTGGGES